ncbi:MAG: 23S rRNA (uracil(1939)-C(5))-methyltransferase RlmD, partial [Abditibacteriota bacterium]|nr:23S rRNA (uracil(1939)-C(5))-methyltransferase RlmD [Abditibacteriota bacterium]
MTAAVPVEAGKIYETEIKTLGVNGEGVGRYEDFTLFVPYALPGERVSVRVAEVKKTFARARLEKIITPSAVRVEPNCPHDGRCGGCQLRHMSYEAQLEAKRQLVTDALVRIGRFENPAVEPVIGAAKPDNYRNKLMFPVGSRNGKILIGCFAGGTRGVVDIHDCPIQDPENIEAVNTVREAAETLGITAYDERRRKGVLRHVVSRVGREGIALCVVTATKKFPQAEEFVDFLTARLPNLAGIQQNIQPNRNGVIMGTETRNLWGKSVITESLCGLTFRVSPTSFFQVNTPQAEALCNKVAEFADLRGTETVADLYCGTGTIGLCLARKAKKVYGTEISPRAVEDAKMNAEMNRIRNAEFIAGDAGKVMRELRHNGVRPDIAVVDPPRS